jgi:hypothetical protein
LQPLPGNPLDLIPPPTEGKAEADGSRVDAPRSYILDTGRRFGKNTPILGGARLAFLAHAL